MKTLGRSRPARRFAALLASGFLFLGCLSAAACGPSVKAPEGLAADERTSGAPSGADRVGHPEFRGASHDLGPDERSGGHTLRKHVGRTDDELRERLAQEDISAASTYTDRAAAQFAVGNALVENSNRVEQWMARSNHPNLVLDYRGNQPVGRTLHRGDSSSRPCADAKVVLRWLSSSEFYVLTSYPECR